MLNLQKKYNFTKRLYKKNMNNNNNCVLPDLLLGRLIIS